MNVSKQKGGWIRPVGHGLPIAGVAEIVPEKSLTGCEGGVGSASVAIWS